MSSLRSGGASGSTDISRVINTGPWTGMQKLVVVLVAFTVLLDGLDSQLIGYAIPVLIKEWGVPRSAFTAVVACGLIGMSLGSVIAGLLGDRIGRRRALLFSVVVFSAATFAIGFADGLFAIGALRLIAGLGIGGALPSATTLAAEFTPARYRTLAVTGTIVCVPLGGMVAGLFAGAIMPDHGWRALFFVGGAIPIVFSVALVLALPESPRYLARHASRWGELTQLLDRMARPMTPETTFTDEAEQPDQRAGIRALFEAARARDTAALWIAFFLCLLAVYSAFSWLPTMLSAQGLNVAVASSGLTAYNCGGVIGSLLCAWTITRIGSRWPQIFCALLAAASAFLLEHVDLGNSALLVFGLGLHGLFVNAVQSTLYAVAAHLYPTNIRATGTASALAFGRLGAILSAFVGAAVISAAGASSYLNVLGFAMLGTALSLAVLRHPIPRRAIATA